MARAPAKLEIEAAPEADRLGTYPHPRHTHRLHGHGAAEAALAQAFASGHMHHAWLIRGPEGIGKATLAYRFAKFALAHPMERDRLGGSLEIAGDTTAARQVAALSHPNLLVLRRPWNHKDKRFAASIPVDEVRRLRNFLSHSAEENAWRIVIVDSADELAGPAANALLKSLEEPPVRLVFLLISSEPGRLLPTIRSRCRTISLTKLEPADLRRAAEDAIAASDGEPPDDANWPKLASLADGSVRRVLSLSGNDGLKIYERIEALLTAMPKVDWTAAHALSDELALASAEQKYETFFDMLLDILARAIRAAALGQPDPRLAFAAKLISAGRLATFADVWETTVRDRAEVQALNLDRKTLILETISRLASAARN
jgi:DNA polymerase III subunit delta'